MTFANDFFTRDIATHQMHVIRDDGVHRHIRFNMRHSWITAQDEDDFSNEYQIWLSGFRRAEAAHHITQPAKGQGS